MKNNKQCNWSELEAQCYFRNIELTKLNVGKYQRGEASISSTRQRASKFSYAASGALVVGERADGTFWIVDGLQRKIAAESRGDITFLPCMVFISRGENHEAEVFLLCNKNRTVVSAFQKYRAAVYAGLSPEKEIEQWVFDNGFCIDDSNTKNDRLIRFPSAFTSAWVINQQAAKNAIIMTQEICKGGSLNVDIFNGIVFLLRNDVDVRRYIKKIMERGGKAVLLKEINAYCIVTGKKKSWTTAAAGILTVINKNLKNKIQIQF